MTTYLEDPREGSEYLSATRTIRKEDITAFAGLSGDFSPLHTDDEWVRKNTPFSSRIAHGALIFSISQGLRTPIIDGIAVIAFLGFERTLVGPVYPGDTITARWTVSQVRRSRSSPDRGIACLQVAVVNQDGTIVQRGSDTYLAAARPEGMGQNGIEMTGRASPASKGDDRPSAGCVRSCRVMRQLRRGLMRGLLVLARSGGM